MLLLGLVNVPFPTSTVDKFKPVYKVSMPKAVLGKWHIYNGKLRNLKSKAAVPLLEAH